MTDARTIDAALVALIGAESEQAVYEAVVTSVHSLLPDAYIAASALSPDGEAFTLTATAGLESVLDPLQRALDVDLMSREFRSRDMRPEDFESYRSGRLERVEGGLYTLSLGQIPESACAVAERLLGVGTVFAIGFAWDEMNYGSLIVAAKTDDEPPHTDVIETLVHQATIVIRRLRAESELRAKTEELDSFFTRNLDLLCIADTDGRFLRLNPEWERTLGYSLSELEGSRFLDYVHPDDLEPTLAAVERLARGDAVIRFVNRYRTKDGGFRWVEWRSYPRDGLIYAAARDLTDRVEAEAEIRALNEGLERHVRERTLQLEAAVAELEAFSYSVSHDLRAPLRAINGYATILADDFSEGIGSEGRRYCDSIIASTRRMGQLIDDLLAFSRLGRTRLAMEAVDMAELASVAFGEITTERERGQVSLTVGDLAPATGDPVLLRQVWVNLLSNALKFTESVRQPRIDVDCRQEPHEIVYSVRDNGAGFDMRHAGKLFQVFERLHGDEVEGSGIGLAIVRRAVEAHGGRVWGEGEEGNGATFSFSLPAKTEANDA